MNALAFLAVGLGAACGAWLRWALGLLFNHWLPQMPPGTLAANLIGGYLIGVAVAVFHIHAEIPTEARLLIVTGFLGGLTTFSTFSAEVVALLRSAQYGWALLAASSHLFGSLMMTALGIWTIQKIAS